MALLAEVIFLLRDLVLALVPGSGARRRYETSIFIAAPRETVWNMLRSRDITFDGRLLSMRAIREQGPSPDIEMHRIRINGNEARMMLRVVELRPGIALQYELLDQGSSPEVVAGDDDFVTYALHDHRGGTQLDLVRELVPRRWMNRVLVPAGLRSGARRYKAKVEQMAIESRQAD